MAENVGVVVSGVADEGAVRAGGREMEGAPEAEPLRGPLRRLLQWRDGVASTTVSPEAALADGRTNRSSMMQVGGAAGFAEKGSVAEQGDPERTVGGGKVGK